MATQKEIKAKLETYRHPDSASKDIHALVQNFKNLKVQNAKQFKHANGTAENLVSLTGTIPVKLRGATYNIPVTLWLRRDHPYQSPIVFVTPTDDMRIQPSQFVDRNGMVYLPYLSEWKANHSDLTALTQVMCATFSENCPVFSQRTKTTSTTTMVAPAATPPRPPQWQPQPPRPPPTSYLPPPAPYPMGPQYSRPPAQHYPQGPGAVSERVETAVVCVPDSGGLETSVSSVPEDCICNICTKVLTSPHLTECCGQHCCERCLQQWEGTSFNITGMCPFCRKDNFIHIQDKRMERKIKDLEAFCPHQDEGCDWKGPLGDVQAVHLSRSCQYTAVECPQGCGMTIKRHALQEHMDYTCLLRRVRCKFCHVESTMGSMVEHHSVCPEYPLRCTGGCDELVARKSMQAHLQRECPQSRSAPVHSAPPHPRATAERRLEARDDDFPTTLQQLSHEVHSLKARVDSLQQENKSLREEMSSMADRVFAAEQWEETTGRLLTRELSFLQPCPPTNASTVAIECLHTSLSKRILKLSPAGPPLVFRLTPYSKFKSSWKVWQSPPFYVDQGYKMCLAVHLNGVGAGESTHISLRLCQLAGEFDSQLMWPFWLSYDFTVTLMKQDTRPHMEPVTLMNEGVDADKHSSRSHLPVFHHPDSPQFFRKRSYSATPRETNPKSKSRTLPSAVDMDDCSLFTVQKMLQPQCPNPLLGRSQVMSVGTWLEKVKGMCLPDGSSCCKLELFCTQSLAKSFVHLDSLVFRCDISYRDNPVD